MALLAAWSTDAGNLWGKASFEASTLSNISSSISISAIILCGLIISGLGVLNVVHRAIICGVGTLLNLLRKPQHVTFSHLPCVSAVTTLPRRYTRLLSPTLEPPYPS